MKPSVKAGVEYEKIIEDVLSKRHKTRHICGAPELYCEVCGLHTNVLISGICESCKYGAHKLLRKDECMVICKQTAQKEREEVLDEVLSILEERGYYHKEVLKLKNVKK